MPTNHRPTVLAGMGVELAGIVAGVLLVVAASGIKSAKVLSAVVAVLGIVLTAFCSHAIGHWLAGRLAGLRFLLSSDHWHGGRRASGQGAE